MKFGFTVGVAVGATAVFALWRSQQQKSDAEWVYPFAPAPSESAEPLSAEEFGQQVETFLNMMFNIPDPDPED